MIRNKKRKKQTDMSSGREQQKNAGIDFFLFSHICCTTHNNIVKNQNSKC